jgi:predicted RNase H-like HicB family nuclease
LKDYHINIFYSEEDGAYVAEIPDLFSCTAFGNTPEEALRELKVAKELWLEVARESGRPIPSPQYRPDARTSRS